MARPTKTVTVSAATARVLASAETIRIQSTVTGPKTVEGREVHFDLSPVEAANLISRLIEGVRISNEMGRLRDIG